MARTRGAQNRYGAATEGHIQARRQRSEMWVKWAERTTMSAGSRYILARQLLAGARSGPSSVTERLSAGRALPTSASLFCSGNIDALLAGHGIYAGRRQPNRLIRRTSNRPVRRSWKAQDPALESSRRALELAPGAPVCCMIFSRS